jgi:hypothetical protein
MTSSRLLLQDDSHNNYFIHGHIHTTGRQEDDMIKNEPSVVALAPRVTT